MVNRIKLTFEQDEYSALLKLAMAELRNPADEARHIVRLELSRRGLLPTPQPADLAPHAQPQPAEVTHGA
jgi:hypothetical protein